MTAILVLGQILSAMAGARLDSSTTALRLIVGPAFAQRIMPTVWGDVGAEFDVNPLFVRGGASLGATGFLKESRKMAPGQTEPETEAWRTSVVGGYQLFWNSGWLALGGGWAWTVFDTLRTDDESRPIYNTTGASWERVDGGVAWVWRERVRRNGPFGAVELGFGLHEIGIGIVLEAGSCNGLGFNFQYRIF